MIDEGYVKYSCDWIESDTVKSQDVTELNLWRDRFYQLGLIGEYPNGIGFGNLSVRDGNSEVFIVSGTKTGSLPTLTEKHYTRVTAFDLDRNWLQCEGPIEASSESLTHAALYQADKTIQAVIHVHNFQLWQRLMNRVPTTAKDCPYGTPEMAKEMYRLFQEENLRERKILVMAGHEEGVIAFGKDLAEAGNILLSHILPSPQQPPRN
ncbi:MAG: class II aldolase/adducin family protein [Halothece sp.]